MGIDAAEHTATRRPYAARMPFLSTIPLLSPLVAAALAAGPEHRSTVPVPREDAGILARQAEVLQRARESSPVPMVFLGDSITQGWEDPGEAAWTAAFAPLGAVNLGVSGDRTEHVLWRLAQAPITRLEPKVVVVLIGTNNLGHGTANAEQTFDGAAKVVETVLAQAPEATVALCAILPRDGRFTPIRRDCLAVNQALAARFAAEPRVRFLDFGGRYLDRDASIPADLMPDGLHLSPAGYAIWAGALAPVIRERLGPG